MMDPTVSLIYLPSALLLGALHALEPGHAKTLTAAYLIGIKGTKRDAMVLGLSVATTHSIVVVLIATTALLLGERAFAGNAAHWLEVGSGLVVILLGCWLLWRRWPRRRTTKAHSHNHDHSHHQHSPDPVAFSGRLASGAMDIIDTPRGERMRCKVATPATGLNVLVHIARSGGQTETLSFEPDPQTPTQFISTVTPQEPHEFSAQLEFKQSGNQETLSFSMTEPEGHRREHGHEPHHDDGHDHADLDEEAHARAHAEALPDYVKQGEHPTLGQIIAFGAAGGMIPCPASITVMLMALSIGKSALGILTVLAFSVGLAITLVGMGLLVVFGLSGLESTGRFHWVSKRAPLISAGVVVLSGLFALIMAH